MRTPAAPETAAIADTLADGRGVAHTEGKTVFIPGALTGEKVVFRRRRRRRRFDEGELIEVLEASPQRIEPRCEVFGRCGACSLQHLAPEQQLGLKQAVLLDNLDRIGDLVPEKVLEPVTGPVWGYRRKARLAVKDVIRKGRVLVGFREQGKPYVIDMRRCETLHPEVGEQLTELASLVAELTIRARLPQIEVAVGDEATVLVMRVLDPPSREDLDKLADYSHRTGHHVLLQPGGSDTIHPLPNFHTDFDLAYSLPEFDLDIHFAPTDFIQVNKVVNQQMVHRVVELLALGSKSRVLDLFCGLGNFTLPIARRAGYVLGIEGSVVMVASAQANAARAGLENAEFRAADLTKSDSLRALADDSFDAVLLDPPRAGAGEILDQLGKISPPRIVYVSCHPATLARDAGRLVDDFGYRLAAAGIMDMFPQTSHVESVALLTR